MVEISIIIPVYNEEKYLKECLDSILIQNLEDIEIICVDDGSCDKSFEILNEYAKKDTRIICTHQQNLGSAAARNKAIKLAKGEYIGFIDADDIFINENSLKIMYDWACANNADIVSGNLKFLTEKRKIIDNKHYSKGTFYYFNQNCVISSDDYGIPFYFTKNLYKRELIIKNEIEFPDILKGEDPIFLSKILACVDEIYGVPIDFYGYMVPTSFSKLDTYFKKFDYIYQYKECFDILNNAGLYKTSNKYIGNLMLFLAESMKNNDYEIYDIVCDVFNDDLNYFKHYINEYNTFKAYFMIKMIFEINSEEYYYISKSKISDNKITDKDLVEKINILTSSESFNEFKISVLKYELDKFDTQINMLKHENKLLENELDLKNKPSKITKVLKFFRGR